MTKRDYERIAIAFQECQPESPKSSDYKQWERCICAVAKQLYYDNSLFVEGRFRAACNNGANVKALREIVIRKDSRYNGALQSQTRKRMGTK